MRNRNIEKNHEYWQLKNHLKSLLKECKAKTTTRYCIDCVYVGENILATTDGRRLVEVKYNHLIEKGIYFCTSDGFLLNQKDEQKFPKYTDIIPHKNKLKKVVSVRGEGIDIIGLVLGKLCYCGCICRLNLYQKPIGILSKIISGQVEVFVYKEDVANSPFLIEAETTIGFVRYLQMPVTVKNKILAEEQAKKENE